MVLAQAAGMKNKQFGESDSTRSHLTSCPFTPTLMRECEVAHYVLIAELTYSFNIHVDFENITIIIEAEIATTL